MAGVPEARAFPFVELGPGERGERKYPHVVEKHIVCTAAAVKVAARVSLIRTVLR